MFACAKQLATANRLQRYNKNLKYTKEFMFFVVFLLSRTPNTYFRNVLLNSEKVITDLF